MTEGCTASDRGVHSPHKGMHNHKGGPTAAITQQDEPHVLQAGHFRDLSGSNSVRELIPRDLPLRDGGAPRSEAAALATHEGARKRKLIETYSQGTWQILDLRGKESTIGWEESS